MSEFQTSFSQKIHVRLTVFDNLFVEMGSLVLMVIVPRHKSFTILSHHTSRIIVIYVRETINDDLLMFAFVEKMREVSFDQLGQIERLWTFRESHWIKFIESMNFIFR